MKREDSNFEFLKVTEEAVFNAGKIALEFEKKKIKTWYKSENQPVTEADILINNYLQKFFKEKTPNFGWLSEESVDDNSRYCKDYFWCLDPIDGTRSFINGKPEYTISLALMLKSTPIFGIIYNPKTREMFSAKKKFGAFCNKKKIYVENKEMTKSKIALSSSEFKIMEKYKNLNNLKVTKMGSIAYKIALVAKGDIDIAISFTKKNDWDLAAASVILEEAGGILSQTNGKQISYNTKELKISSVVASNKINHKKIVNKILLHEV